MDEWQRKSPHEVQVYIWDEDGFEKRENYWLQELENIYEINKLIEFVSNYYPERRTCRLFLQHSFFT